MPSKESSQKQASRNGQITNLINADGFRPVQACLLPLESTLFLSTTHSQDDIARFPIRALVGLSFEDDLVAFWTTLLNFQGEVCGMVQDFRPTTVWTYFLDEFPSSTTVAACYLSLGEHAREYLLFHNSDPGPVTRRTGVYIVVRGGTTSSTVIAEDLFLDYELGVTRIKRWPRKGSNR